MENHAFRFYFITYIFEWIGILDDLPPNSSSSLLTFTLFWCIVMWEHTFTLPLCLYSCANNQVKYYVNIFLPLLSGSVASVIQMIGVFFFFQLKPALLCCGTCLWLVFCVLFVGLIKSFILKGTWAQVYSSYIKLHHILIFNIELLNNSRIHV